MSNTGGRLPLSPSLSYEYQRLPSWAIDFHLELFVLAFGSHDATPLGHARLGRAGGSGRLLDINPSSESRLAEVILSLDLLPWRPLLIEFHHLPLELVEEVLRMLRTWHMVRAPLGYS